MSNPYRIDGPAQVSFSGGRSSGMMLCKIVEAHGGTLPDNVIVAFANTGKEREETLRFVQRCAEHLGIDVRWLEYDPKDGPWKMGATASERFRDVNFETASRNGEPFAEAIRRAGMPPSVVVRHCTAYLKIKPMEAIMRGFGDYVRVVGLRADEPRRVSKMRDRGAAMPLADAGVTREDVRSFWDAMPFDLELPTINGETVGGNCDLCYLKGAQKIIGLIRENPASADWWIEQEQRTGKLPPELCGAQGDRAATAIGLRRGERGFATVRMR